MNKFRKCHLSRRVPLARLAWLRIGACNVRDSQIQHTTAPKIVQWMLFGKAGLEWIDWPRAITKRPFLVEPPKKWNEQLTNKRKNETRKRIIQTRKREIRTGKRIILFYSFSRSIFSYFFVRRIPAYALFSSGVWKMRNIRQKQFFVTGVPGVSRRMTRNSQKCVFSRFAEMNYSFPRQHWTWGWAWGLAWAKGWAWEWRWG